MTDLVPLSDDQLDAVTGGAGEFMPPDEPDFPGRGRDPIELIYIWY